MLTAKQEITIAAASPLDELFVLGVDKVTADESASKKGLTLIFHGCIVGLWAMLKP